MAVLPAALFGAALLLLIGYIYERQWRLIDIDYETGRLVEITLVAGRELVQGKVGVDTYYVDLVLDEKNGNGMLRDVLLTVRWWADLWKWDPFLGEKVRILVHTESHPWTGEKRKKAALNRVERISPAR